MNLLGRMLNVFLPDVVFKFLAYKKAPIEIGLFGPSRIGKTTLIASMVEEFKVYHDTLLKHGKDCLNLVADKNTSKILSKKRSELDSGIDAQSFRFVGKLSSTSSHETFELKLSSHGDDGFSPKIRFNDFPGGWITDPSRLDELKIKDWNIVIIPVDAAVIMQSHQKKHMLLARELLGVNYVEDFVREWLGRRKNKPGLCIFAPVKCETYFTTPAMGVFLSDKSQELLKRTKEFYGKTISQLEGCDQISCLYMPVNTVGCCYLMDYSWSDSEFSATYSTDVLLGRTWLPYGPANIVLEICKFIAKIIRCSNIDMHTYKYFLSAVDELDDLMAESRVGQERSLPAYSRKQVLN